MRRLPLLIAAVIAIVLASLVHGTPEPTPADAAPAGRAGFSPGGGFLFASAASQAADVRTMTAAGGRWIRLDIDWSAIETSRGTYNWARTDQAVNSARAGGMSVIGLLGYTPAWARPAGTTVRRPPTNPADMAAFASGVATPGVVTNDQQAAMLADACWWRPGPGCGPSRAARRAL